MVPMKVRILFSIFLVGLLPGWVRSKAQPGGTAKSQPGKTTRSHPGPTARAPYTGYLFVYFTGNEGSQEAIRFAISGDGFHYRTLNGNQPVLSSEKISSSGGVRDPNIIRGEDGKTFYMVATDMVSAKGWSSNRAMVLLRSTDLLHWTSAVVNIQTHYARQEKLERVWAPQTIYDDSAKKYMIYFSLKYQGEADKICYAYVNRNFTDLEGPPSQLFFKADGGSCIDADIAKRNGRYYLFFKTEDSRPGIKIAVSDHLTRGYVLQSDDYVEQTDKPVEGAGTFRLNNGEGYILMYDMYTSGAYQFTRTTDFRNFAVADSEVDMDFHPRHGTVMPITESEARRLTARWLTPDISLLTPSNKAIIGSNQLIFHVRPGTDLHHFDPGFITYPGVSITPQGVQDFSKAAVRYTVRIAGRGKKYFIKIK